jgi:hypothetical protein
MAPRSYAAAQNPQLVRDGQPPKDARPTVTFLFDKGALAYLLRQRHNQPEDTKLMCPKQSASWVMTSRTSRLEAVNNRGG